MRRLTLGVLLLRRVYGRGFILEVCLRWGVQFRGVFTVGVARLRRVYGRGCISFSSTLFLTDGGSSTIATAEELPNHCLLDTH